MKVEALAGKMVMMVKPLRLKMLQQQIKKERNETGTWELVKQTLHTEVVMNCNFCGILVFKIIFEFA